ncbi:MAG: CRISPR system precrRNA processing endoribonuclease RAMP protein Cas6 [Bacteroides sp.]|nr:CRISPR system precrRNA processing endoribonuclease RAMP protein Cas6 [Prevotella sp.]MCM1406951.1 CRISPR system precrRNA processing endoribonuclease RAMP protein Cas6 [Treponema brennaborense]MCM1470102.1 CRISPR system precrRNA processing endoribonuclease RAMP protein Cas6 [Bacteroides sp.]
MKPMHGTGGGNLLYLPVHFLLRFESPCFADTNPLFVLRSVLGKNLHSMCCISKKTVCTECLYRETCVYSFIFETILPQNNLVLPGRNKGCHPYSFSVKKRERENPISAYSFTITLFGKAIESLPYIYAAFVRAGTCGLFKSRTQFKVESVTACEKNILLDENHLDLETEPALWGFSDECEANSHELLVELNSPLRFKFGGKYGTNFTAQDFMNCLCRRAKTLCSLYGEISEKEKSKKYTASESMRIEDRKIRWIDLNHYSARQKNAMELGGAVGTFKLSGKFSNFELSLLELAKIAGAGKSTNFGLGQIDYWIKNNF